MSKIKEPSTSIEWIDFVQGRTKIKTDKKGFAHVLVFTYNKVFPCVYNGFKGSFTCGSLYINNIQKFAYMPKIE